MRQGDVIGTVIPNTENKASMLHFEIYDGSESGKLTDKDNKKYKNVPNANYERRSDLRNPTFVKDLPMFNK